MNAATFICAFLIGWAVYSALLFFVVRAAIGLIGMRWPVGLAAAGALPAVSMLMLWILFQREEWRRIDWNFPEDVFFPMAWLFIAGLPSVMIAIVRGDSK